MHTTHDTNKQPTTWRGARTCALQEVNVRLHHGGNLGRHRQVRRQRRLTPLKGADLRRVNVRHRSRGSGGSCVRHCGRGRAGCWRWCSGRGRRRGGRCWGRASCRFSCCACGGGAIGCRWRRSRRGCACRIASCSLRLGLHLQAIGSNDGRCEHFKIACQHARHSSRQHSGADRCCLL